MEPIKIWELPRPGRTYILGADIGTCVDPTAIEVVNEDTGNQCAELMILGGDPVAPAKPIIDLALMYNRALVAVEVNSLGMVTNSILIREYEYENLYRWKMLDRVEEYMTDVLGWWTNTKTRPAIISALKGAVYNNRLRGADLINECLNMLAGDEDRPDDRAMAFGIASAIREANLMLIGGK